MLFSDKNIIKRIDQLENYLIDTLDAIEQQFSVLNFRITRPEVFTITCISQRKEKIMGKIVQVFTYQIDLAAVPVMNDAVSQTVSCTGVFQDAENTSVGVSQQFGREAASLTIDAVEGNEVAIELAYVDPQGNHTADPLRMAFTVIDGIGPEVPADALTIKQTAQRAVELPDKEEVSEE